MKKSESCFISNKNVLYILLISGLSVFLSPRQSYAQSQSEKGLPFITNYSPKTYKAYPQAWCVLEDESGIMYFGTQAVLLEYDGIKWRKISLQSNAGTAVVRSMVKHKDGLIYYGAFGDIGYLDYDSLGQRKPVSLLGLVPNKYRNFLDVWSTHSTESGIYFQAREYIFRLEDKKPGDSQRRMMKAWTPQTKFMYSFYLDNVFYVHQQGLGLYKMENDSLVFVPGSEFLGKERMQVMLPYKSADNKKQYLIGMFYGGLYLYDGKTFQPFATEADPIIKSGSILYKGLQMRNGNYVFSTTGKGLVIIDAQGHLLQRINRDVGLQDESIYSTYEDKKGALWLALDNGISRVETSSPLSKFALQSGINTGVLNILRYDGSLFIGTTNGLLRFNNKTSFFDPIGGIPQNQIFTLLPDKNQLLIPGDGLFAFKDNKTYILRSSVSADLTLSALYISKKYPNVLFGGGTFGVAIFTRPTGNNQVKEAGAWKFEGYIKGITDQIWSFSENKDGTIWAGTQAGNVFLLKPAIDEKGNLDLPKTSFEAYGSLNGFKNGLGQVYSIKGVNYFIADSAIYTFDEKTKRFISDSSFGNFNMGGGNNEFDMAEDFQGRVWIRFGKETRLAIPKPEGGYRIERNQLSSIDELTIQKIYPEDNGIVWLCTTDGLIRYDENLEKKSDQSFKSVIRYISAGKNLLSTVLGRKEKPVSVSFDNNTMRFEYAAPFFEHEEKTIYQTWLEGFEKDWSGFGNNYYKEFTNLPAGSYHFHVRAKNIYQSISDEAVYSFSIYPPWYRTMLAYFLYALAFIAMLYWIIRYRTRHLHEKQRELEKEVADRTSQLSLRVEELAVINSVQEGLVREMDMKGIYKLVGDRICELFNSQSVFIRSFDLDSGLEQWQYVVEKGERLYSEPRPLIWANKLLIQTKQHLLVNENYVETARKHGGTGVSKGLPPKSALFVPMVTGDIVRGSVSLQNVESENAFSESDVRLLTTMANSMSVALENARLFDETNRLLGEAKQSTAELSTVNSISKALASQLDPDDLIKMVGDQLKDLFKANVVYLALLNKKTNIIHFPYQYGDEMDPIKLGEGLTSKIIKNGEPLLINKDLNELRAQLGIKQIGVPAASYLGVPIPVGDEIIGVLSIQSTEKENRFNENDLRLLSTIGSSVGVALRNATLFDEVQQAKMEAEAASKLAEKANEAKSAFLSTVSHELRTPLTSVLGFAKIIKKRLEERIFPIVDKSDPKTEKAINQVSENLHVVISEGERLTHLINDVLDLAKIEAGKMEFSQENVSMPEVAERAIAATTSLFDQKDLELIRQIDSDLPEIIGDKDKLIQVIINLISNSVKFTDAGSITCRLRQEKDELIVSIIDTGIGIAPGDYGAVFEQFKQVGGDTLTDKPKGTGLGLPICKEIVEHLGGRIWLESELGKGSSFSFALPIIKKKVADRPIHLNDLVRQLKEQVAHSKLNIIGQTANILIVDDDESIRSLLHQELGDAGYNINEASDGKEALERVRTNRPDLIILDIMMPEMNGFDVAAVLKNDPQTMDIPIIVLSVVQDKARGFRIGVDRYLTKPIDTDLLFNEIGNLLEQGKSKRKVMIVDEDTAAVSTLTEVLKTKGYEVMESNERELLENAVANQPDIIIINSILSGKQDIVKTLRFEKGLENVLFLVYQ